MKRMTDTFDAKVYRPLDDKPEDNELFITYWRGLDKDDAMVSFDVMMDLLPKVWISVQFLPTLIFASFLSIKFFGGVNIYKIYIKNCVMLVFALVTNISFYKRKTQVKKDQDVELSSTFPSSEASQHLGGVVQIISRKILGRFKNSFSIFYHSCSSLNTKKHQI